MHKYAFLLLPFLQLPIQSSGMDMKVPLSPKSTALNNQMVDPVDEEALSIFLQILKIKKASKNTTLSVKTKERIYSDLKKFDTPILIYRALKLIGH